MADTAELTEIERLCWRLTGWKAEPGTVDALLSAISAYVQSNGAPALTPSGLRPCTCEEGGEAPAQQPAAATVAPADAEPVQEAHTGAQTFPLDGLRTVTFTGTFTLHPLTGGPVQTPASLPEPEPVHERAPEPVARVQVQPVAPVTDTPVRICRKDDCHAKGTPQPITEFSRDSKATAGRKWTCRVCDNKRKREGRANAARARLGR